MTQPTNPPAKNFPAFFMLGFLLFGTVWVWGFRTPDPLPQDKTILSGEWASSFEKGFDQSLPLRGSGIATWTALEWLAFGETRAGALVGRAGWLFTDEEFKFYPKELSETQAKLERIVALNRRLKQQKITLLVALLPSKARAVSQHLGRYVLPNYTQNRYSSFRNALLQAGILAPNLERVLNNTPKQAPEQASELFLRTDTHWTPKGAKKVAFALSQSVKTLPPLLPKQRFISQKGESQSYAGDLLKYLPLGIWAKFGPAPDTLETWKTEQVTPPKAGSSGDLLGNDLLGNNAVSVALVGTSYSANSKWNFAGFLQEALQTEVLNVALEGKGPMIPMTDYLENAAFKESPPQLIIWEIPERFLPQH
jgi:alginate O-acetyltransferase complex protein AlgJ